MTFSVKLFEMYKMVEHIRTSFLTRLLTCEYFEFAEMCIIADPLQNELKYPYILLYDNCLRTVNYSCGDTSQVHEVVFLYVPPHVSEYPSMPTQFPPCDII